MKNLSPIKRLYRLSNKVAAVKAVAKKILLSSEMGKSACLSFEKVHNPLFKSVEIETTSICNRKCTYCPNYSNKRSYGYMENKLFYKIIDELSEIGFSGRLSPHFYGEPLLDKRIVKFISYTRSRLPNAFIKFFTNGDLLTYDLFMQLIDAGVDIFRISQHDPVPTKTMTETLGRIDERTRQGRLEYVKYFDNDELLMNRGGLVGVKHDVKLTFCDYISGVTIDYEGNMLLCCQDYISKNRFGNLKAEKIMDVWNKSYYKVLRDRIRCGIWPLDICLVCNGLKSSVQ